MSPELQALGAAVLAALPRGSELELIVRLPGGGGVVIKNLPPALEVQVAETVPERLLPATTDRRRRPREQAPDRRKQGERILGGRRKVRAVADDRAPRNAPTVAAAKPGPGKGRKVCPECRETCGTKAAVCPGINCAHVFRIDG